jgi:hypothetical protein
MRRKIVITLLALGVFAGYGTGIARLVHAHHGTCAGWHHE